MIRGIKVRTFANQPRDVFCILDFPFLLQKVGLFVHYGEISRTIVASSYQRLYLPRLVPFLRICEKPHLLLIVLHHLGPRAVLTRVIQQKLTPKETGIHLSQKTDMFLTDMNLTSREDIFGEALLLTREDELLGLLKVELVC